MALLLGTRVWDGTRLDVKHFKDFDVYTKSPEHYKEIRHELIYRSNARTVYDTENATTYIVNGETVQLVKKKHGDPISILSTFDFANCAIGFRPNNNTIYANLDGIKAHCKQELEILDPWMLNFLTKETLHNVVVQLVRFKKYCERWNYTLSYRSLNRLLQVYNEYPNLEIKAGEIYQLGSNEEK